MFPCSQCGFYRVVERDSRPKVFFCIIKSVTFQGSDKIYEFTNPLELYTVNELRFFYFLFQYSYFEKKVIGTNDKNDKLLFLNALIRKVERKKLTDFIKFTLK